MPFWRDVIGVNPHSFFGQYFFGDWGSFGNINSIVLAIGGTLLFVAVFKLFWEELYWPIPLVIAVVNLVCAPFAAMLTIGFIVLAMAVAFFVNAGD
ncbi:MAG: hypothetical protein WA843_00280 [Candidatus Saccharimonadales bacterium]